MRMPRVTADIPDFLIKATLGCSLTVILILTPFAVNNFIQQRFVIAVGVTLIIAVCGINVWHGVHGRYSLWVNTYLVAPIGAFTITYALLKLGASGSYWPLLLVVAYYFVLPEKRAQFFNAVSLLANLPSAWLVLEPSLAFRFSAVLLGISLFAYISMRVIYSMYGLLHGQAVTDKLTGLYNRTLLDDALHHAIAQNQRTSVPMTLIGFDIDKFKSINDTLGHNAGDGILKAFGEMLKIRARSSDMAFRIGGDEFLILAHNTDEYHAVRIAERFRHEIAQSPLLPGHQITISVGVSGRKEDMDVAAWMKSCDEKLYAAKASGRNSVVV